MNIYQKNFYNLLVSNFKTKLPDCALPHFNDALNEVQGAGLSLCVAANEDQRGELTAFFWKFKPETMAFRELLAGTWIHNHREVERAVQTRKNLIAMFTEAKFILPDEIPDIVTLYRGSSYLTLKQSKRAPCWTTDKRVAAFFAMRFAEKNGNPTVLKTIVPKSKILFYSNDRGEREAVCFSVKNVGIDGNPEEWVKLMRDYIEEKKQETPKFLQKLI